MQNLFPPAHTPLQLQSQMVREVVAEDFLSSVGAGRPALFRGKPFCSRGHPVWAQPAPVRLCCFTCRKPLGHSAYCCTQCRRDWLCESCIVLAEHPMRRACRDLRAPTACNDGKQRYVKDPLDKRRARFQDDLAVVRRRVEALVDPPAPDNRPPRRDTQAAPLAPSGGTIRSKLPVARPRLYLSATPKSFFRETGNAGVSQSGESPHRRRGS